MSAASAFCAPARQQQLRMRASTVRAWARDATQQSERLRAPLLGLAPVLPLSDALRLFTEAKPPLLVPGPRLVLFCDERLAATRSQDIGGAVSAWRREFAGGRGTIALVIGPEGGLTDKERAIASSSTLTRCVRLTSSVLRAETAAIAALAQLLARWRGPHAAAPNQS
jgi:16S rRNA (uracil1498-N3)-methyltransferase